MHYLETGELLPEPDFAERIRVMNRHFDLMIEVFGENLGLHHVPQGRPVVREAIRAGIALQQGHRPHFHPRRL